MHFITFLILSLDLASAAPAPSGISSALTGASRSGSSRALDTAAGTGSVEASAAARNLARNSAIEGHGAQQLNKAGSYLENHGQNLAPVTMRKLDKISLARSSASRGSSNLDELASAEKAPVKMSKLSIAGRVGAGTLMVGAVGGILGIAGSDVPKQKRH